MMLSGGEVRAIASEARLSLTDGELESSARYVNDFLDMADRFKELDLKNVEPFCFPETSQCPLREDAPQPFAAMPEIFSSSERADANGFFKVPRIMEE